MRHPVEIRDAVGYIRVRSDRGESIKNPKLEVKYVEISLRTNGGVREPPPE